MTNDVRKLKNHFIVADSDKERILVEIYKKNPRIADILFDSLYRDLYRQSDGAFTNSLTPTIEAYKALYEKAGVEMPEVFSQINTISDFYKTFNI